METKPEVPEDQQHMYYRIGNERRCMYCDQKPSDTACPSRVHAKELVEKLKAEGKL